MDVKRGAWIAAGLVAAFAVPLALGQAYWQENDDGFMAMVAHGYGVTAAPSIAGAQTYGVFTYGLLAAAAIGAAYALWRAGVSGGFAAAALFALGALVRVGEASWRVPPSPVSSRTGSTMRRRPGSSMWRCTRPACASPTGD